jgi:hypothetical protein
MLSLDLESLTVETFATLAPATGTTSGTTMGSLTGPCCSFGDSCSGPVACLCDPQTAAAY